MISLAGQSFGRWSVIKLSHVDQYWNDYWFCQCECGAKRTVQGGGLRNGRSQSCGCLKLEKAMKHGHAAGGKKSPEHRAWDSMIRRCRNPTTKKYNLYGGRGIAVADRWLSFENFYADVGPRPSGTTKTGRAIYSLDRWPDPDGDYEPGNVRWATDLQQRHNRSKL
jgi:hypothetical protein